MLNKYNFKGAAPRVMTLLDPINGTTAIGSDGQPVTFTLHGHDSEVFRNSMRRHGNQKLKSKRQKQTIEEVEETSTKILAEATVGWSNNIVQEDGADPIEFSQQNAEWLYNEFAWIREQVDTFIHERENFLTGA